LLKAVRVETSSAEYHPPTIILTAPSHRRGFVLRPDLNYGDNALNSVWAATDFSLSGLASLSSRASSDIGRPAIQGQTHSRRSAGVTNRGATSIAGEPGVQLSNQKNATIWQSAARRAPAHNDNVAYPLPRVDDRRGNDVIAVTVSPRIKDGRARKSKAAIRYLTKFGVGCDHAFA